VNTKTKKARTLLSRSSQSRKNSKMHVNKITKSRALRTRKLACSAVTVLLVGCQAKDYNISIALCKQRSLLIRKNGA
jgi:hypothetical protein